MLVLQFVQLPNFKHVIQYLFNTCIIWCAFSISDLTAHGSDKRCPITMRDCTTCDFIKYLSTCSFWNKKISLSTMFPIVSKFILHQTCMVTLQLRMLYTCEISTTMLSTSLDVIHGQISISQHDMDTKQNKLHRIESNRIEMN